VRLGHTTERNTGRDKKARRRLICNSRAHQALRDSLCLLTAAG